MPHKPGADVGKSRGQCGVGRQGTCAEIVADARERVQPSLRSRSTAYCPATSGLKHVYGRL